LHLDSAEEGECKAMEDLVAFVQDNLLAVGVTVLALAALLVVLLGQASKKPRVFLDPTDFQPLKLARIEQMTHNTKRLTFDLPDKKMRLGLPTGQHITFFGKDEEVKDVYR
jgi:cytochrome-b5 reductase